MKINGAKKQTIFLTLINAVVRVMGFIMRIWTSRNLGAEMMGIMEMAQNVHMLSIAPLTSGLPVAISRLTAQELPAKKGRMLYAGISLVRFSSCILVPILLLGSPCIAHLLGDVRVIPSLWFSAPCILILGYSAVYNGYCYGTDQPCIPAVSELLEQLVRVLLTIVMVNTFTGLTSAWLAAVPAAATFIAELLGLYYVLWCANVPKTKYSPKHIDIMTVCKLALPITISRLIQTLFRSVAGLIIPLRLQASGLTPSAATVQLGQLNGMVSPVLFLPGIFTSALSMISIPRMARAEKQPVEIKRLIMLNLLVSLPVSAVLAGAVYVTAPLLASLLFAHPEISVLFRKCALQMPLITTNQILTSVLSALGQQRSSVNTSLVSSAVMVVFVWCLACDPELRVLGVIYAQYIHLIISLVLNIITLIRWHSKNQSL